MGDVVYVGKVHSCCKVAVYCLSSPSFLGPRKGGRKNATFEWSCVRRQLATKCDLRSVSTVDHNCL